MSQGTGKLDSSEEPSAGSDTLRPWSFSPSLSVRRRFVIQLDLSVCPDIPQEKQTNTNVLPFLVLAIGTSVH